jgi:TolB-like protein
MKNILSPFRWGIATIVLAVVIHLPALPVSAAQQPEISQVAVMPFLTAGTSARQSKELTQTLDCELSGLCTLPGSTLTHAEETLTRQMHESLTERLANELIPQQDVTDRFLGMMKKTDETPRDLAQRFGQQIKANYVLVGIIWRFEQRVGESLSAEKPASVAFNSYLVRVADKQLVWQGRFDKTQSALSDNLLNASLFFKSGVKWLSAEELAEYGVEQVVEDFPVPLLDN